MRPVTFIEAGSVNDAIEALGHDNARLIAGGSDLLGELKEGYVDYSRLVSLVSVGGLGSIESHDGGLRIGALVTISELEFSSQLTGPFGMLAEAARSVATPEVRNQGTLGGNLCQRPRCYFYRSALTPCLKKGGDGCPAVESPYQNYLAIFPPPGRGGSGRDVVGHDCYATNPSDLAPPLIALDAEVVVEGPDGARQMPLGSFFTGPDIDVRRENVLRRGELVTHAILPPRARGWRGVYSKARERTAGDFALASAAIGYELVDGRMQGVRVVLGGIAPTPFRSAEAESVLEGQAPTEDVAKRAADAALANAQPLAHNAFKVDLTHALIWRGVMRLATNR